MLPQTSLLAFISLALALPTSSPPLRLIQTAPSSPAQLLPASAKFSLLTAHNIPFIDITSAPDPSLFSSLQKTTPHRRNALQKRARQHTVADAQQRRPGQKPGEYAREASPYPTDLRHREEIYAFVNASSLDGPKAWLQNLTGFFNRHYESETGAEAGEWLFYLVQELVGDAEGIEVVQIEHEFAQRSVVARISGATDELGEISNPPLLLPALSPLFPGHMNQL